MIKNDLSTEIEILKNQMAELQGIVRTLTRGKTTNNPSLLENDHSVRVSYSGSYNRLGQSFRWEPREQTMCQLLKQNGEKISKVLVALGNRQRLEILRAVLEKSLTGAELVEQLNMGTTGQLYHHIKALHGADLLIQEQGGRYTIPAQRIMPFLLLLAASSELLETSDYMSMTEARDNPGTYLGEAKGKYDPHLLLWAVVENSILEHRANHCSDVNIFLHADGSATIADNGRGIPTQTLPNANRTVVQNTLTDMAGLGKEDSFKVPGAEGGISIPVVNALSESLTVEIRRKGIVYRQDYRHGIPKSSLNKVGVTEERGTSISFKPNIDLFENGFDPERISQRAYQMASIYPGLSVHVYGNHTKED